MSICGNTGQIGCDVFVFSAYSVQLKAGALFGTGLLSEKVYNFGYLKVNGRNRMEQKMNMYSDFILKSRSGTKSYWLNFSSLLTFPLKILSQVKGSSDLRVGQF